MSSNSSKMADSTILIMQELAEQCKDNKKPEVCLKWAVADLRVQCKKECPPSQETCWTDYHPSRDWHPAVPYTACRKTGVRQKCLDNCEKFDEKFVEDIMEMHF